MNKEEFLKELQGRIRVLAEPEQQDILAEYAQHIDLRTAAGLTEEEAIRDFGDLGQLAAEILDAYHVDSRCLDAPSSGRKPLLPGFSNALLRACSGMGGFFRSLGRRIAELARRCGRGIAAGFRRCRLGLKALFRPRSPAAPPSEKTIAKEVSPMKSRSHPVFTGAGQTARRAARGFGRLCRIVLHLAWNLLVTLCALPFAAGSMLALICIGLLLVLLVQGYPLTGLFLCFLGGGLCCVSILGLAVTLFRRRPRTAPAEAPVSTAATDLNQQPAPEALSAAGDTMEKEASDHA